MKIALVTRSLGFGGAERQITALARGMVARHEVEILTFYGGGGMTADATGVPVIDLEKGGRWNLISFMFRLRRAIREGGFDVVYAFNWGPNLMVALLGPLLGREVRVVWGIRSSFLDLRRYGLFVWLSDKVQPLFSRLPDLIISNSEAGRREAVGRGFPEDRLEVVPNGIDVERFAPNPDARRTQRELLEVVDEECLVGIVSRLDPMKDHPTFLRAVAHAKSLGVRVVPLIVGSGPESYREELVELANSHGLDRAIFLDATGEIERLYPAMDVHVSSSSDGEGFSNAIGEALACGVPCVSTDVGDAALIVGDAGIVVPPGDAEALGRAIAKVWDEIGRYRGKARPRIVENFTIPHLVDRTERLLTGLD